MKKLLKSSALSVAGILLSVGAVTASAQSGSIEGTGPDSDNTITHAATVITTVSNTTELDADVDIDQDADSGTAVTSTNTEAGDAASGAAENESSFMATVEVDNSGAADVVDNSMGGATAGAGESSIETTGPGSENSVTTTHTVSTTVVNDVNLDVDVDVDQDAESGDATVTNNTMGGSATSGDVSNTSSTSLSFMVHN